MTTRRTMSSMAALAVLAFAGPARSETGACYDRAHLATLGQQGLNACAAQRYADADRELNIVYQNSIDQTPPDAPLRQAQRAWITFRDLACAAETAGFEDGSMYPLIYNGCMERQTMHRIEDLFQFEMLR